jgi:ankyrin repeat protein
VAVHRKKNDAARLLLAKGANANALDRQRYDVVTTAAVADDVPLLELVLEGGASPKNVTSPYDGTALIAAAHLGHVEVVQVLIRAGAPLDHVNNLTWTALMESIVLGDGGKRHTETLRALVQAGANVNIPDRAGISPLAHARGRGYREMAQILEKAGAR